MLFLLLLRLEDSLGDVVRFVLPSLTRRRPAPAWRTPTPTAGSGGPADAGGGVAAATERPVRIKIRTSAALLLVRDGPRPRAAFRRTTLRAWRQTAAVHAERVLRPRLAVLSPPAAEGGSLHGGLGASQPTDLPADHSLSVQEAGLFLLAQVHPSLLTGRTSALWTVAAAVLVTQRTQQGSFKIMATSKSFRIV